MRLAAYFIVLFFLLFISAPAQAQEEKTFRGWVGDSIAKTAIENCTVTAKTKEGKQLKTVTNEEGLFSIRVKADTIIVLLRSTGYKEQQHLLVVPGQGGRDSFYLAPANQVLDNIVIKAKVPPVVIRGDTTEFNIDSSMFDSYDVVEDLVKRLPGLEIDEDGRMSFQGKPITRILVDGEDLFAGDPNFSMKKLPAGLVAKIQVMDTKTLEQIFNKDLVNGDDKTLNIKLKPGNKLFGNAGATAGTKNQLQGEASISSFEDRKRLSLLGSFNSSNKIAFTKLQDGPSASSANTNVAYGNRWKNINSNGSYGYVQSANSGETYAERTQAITADTSFFIQNRSRNKYESNGHRLNLTANWVIDSTSVLDININASIGKSRSGNSAFSTTTENGSLRNQSFNESSSSGDYKNSGGSLFWAKQFAKRGRRLSVSFRTATSSQQSNVFTQSTNTYFKNALPFSGDTLDRNTKTTGGNRTYGVGLSYNEPVSTNFSVNLRSDFDFNKTETSRSVYNLDSGSHAAEYDSLYSAQILSANYTQNLSASLVYNNKKWNVNSGLAATSQQVLRTLQKETVRQNLMRYSPSVSAAYYLSKTKLLRANFSATTIQPTIEQLQPVPDNSNPLYIRLGNPKLRTAFSQNYNINYSYNSLKNSVSAGLSYTPVSNQIVNAVYYDEFRKQTSRFININGVYGLRGNFSVARTARKEKKSESLGFTSSGGYGQQVFFQSNNQYYSRNYSVQGSLSFTRREQVVRPTNFGVALSSSFTRNWTPADKKILNTTRLNLSPKVDGAYTLFGFIHATLSYQFGYNKIDYHSEQRSVDEYAIHKVDNNLNFRFGKKYSVQTSFSYYYNTQALAGANRQMPAFNLFASAFLLKGRGLINFSAMNLFSPNNDYRRIVGDNFIEDVRTATLRNYFTLKLQYNFIKIEKKDRAGKPGALLIDPY